MLLREAEAAFGEEGGEALLKTQGGDGERDGERPRVGLLVGLCLGEKAWSMRPLRSWNICFCENKGEREVLREKGTKREGKVSGQAGAAPRGSSCLRRAEKLASAPKHSQPIPDVLCLLTPCSY